MRSGKHFKCYVAKIDKEREQQLLSTTLFTDRYFSFICVMRCASTARVRECLSDLTFILSFNKELMRKEQKFSAK